MQQAVDGHVRIRDYLSVSEDQSGIMVEAYRVRYNEYGGKRSDGNIHLTLFLCASGPLPL
jgi:hypothetical protein